MTGMINQPGWLRQRLVGSDDVEADGGVLPVRAPADNSEVGLATARPDAHARTRAKNVRRPLTTAAIKATVSRIGPSTRS